MAPPASYHSTLLKLIGYLDGVEHPKGTEIPSERLAQLTPADLMRWFNKITFDTENPSDDAKPTVRSTSLEFKKKALSYFMPNRLMVWNELSNVGNPTRCTQLNELIKRVKKQEVRKQGVPSRARRALTHEEFKSTQEALRTYQRDPLHDTMNPIWNYGCVASLNFQFHMIARIDDSMNVKMDNFKTCPTFPCYLQTRMNWSKNVQEERDAPWQMIMPCMNTMYCVYATLSLWLEIFLMKFPHAMLTPYLFGFSQDITEEEGATASKNIIQSIFGGTIFKATNTAVREGGGSGALGTHSVRKLAATHCRRSGGSKDERDIRGRWKGRSRVGDRYDDVELPWPDIKVCQMLCIGGPCKYKINADSGVSNAFILEHVVSNIRKRFSDDVALIFGTALLYYAYADESNHVPNVIKSRIFDAMRGVSEHPTENPVEKVPVVCTGNDGEVYIDEISPSMNEPQGQENQDQAIGSINDRPIRDQLRALQSQVLSIKNQIHEIDKRIQDDHLSTTRQMQSLNANIKRIGVSPARPIRATTAPLTTAALSPHPRTLYELWDEYTTGLGGRKPARECNAQERGKVKYKYYRRKKAWDLISSLTRSGLQHHVAIDRIYQVYGRKKSVTQIIKLIQADQKRKYIPPLLRI